MTGRRLSSESEGERPEISLTRPMIDQSPSKEAAITSYYDEASKPVIWINFLHRTTLDFFAESNEGK